MSTDERFRAVAAAIDAVDEEFRKLSLTVGEDLPPELRYKLHALASSFGDYTFWVRRRAQDGDLSDRPEDQMYYAEEIETGIGAWGVTAREALDNYFRDDILDHRR